VLVILLHYAVRRQAGIAVLQHVRPLWALLEMWWCGVDLFFVISGFLIGGILLDNRESPRLLRAFYVRRACRILPLYLLLLALAFGPILGGPSAAGDSQVPFAAYVLFGQNFWTSMGVSSVAWLTPTWSVAIEEQFYLMAPFAVALLSRRALVRVVLGCIIAAPLLRIASFQGLVPVSSWDFTLCRIDAPAYGVLGALLVRDAGGLAALRAHAPTLERALPLLLAGYVALSQLQLVPWGEAAIMTVGLSYLALSALVLLLVVQHCPDSVAARIARAAPLVRIGQRSYFLYLFHTPLIDGLAVLRVAYWTRVAVAVALLWMLAEVSWRYVEEPILRFGRRQRYA
jgi:peptidoglycan/LPS O-acetylase OafA/YrhL